MKDNNNSIFPNKDEKIMSAYMEEVKREQREYLKKGKMLRGQFGRRRIQLPENLIKGLERVWKVGKEKKWHNNSISSMICDAIIEYLFVIYDNGCLDPDYTFPTDEWRESTYGIIQKIVDSVPGRPKKRELIEYARSKFPKEFKSVSNKTLENYIWHAWKHKQTQKMIDTTKNTQN